MRFLPQIPSRQSLMGLVPHLLFVLVTWTAFILFFDASVLNPQNIGWIADGDLRQHYLGWTAFRQAQSLGEPWGLSPLLAYPLGAPISSTDSNPFFSLLLWPFESWLPENFQFIGPWYLLSLALSLLFSTLLLRQFGFGKYPALLLGAVLAFQPILFWRYGHDTLMAHWLILAAFLVSVAIKRPGRAMLAHALLLTLSISIHPYLFVMLNFVLGFDVLARVLRSNGLRFGVLERSALALVATEVAALYIGKKLGVFSLSTPSENEIGVHSADPLGFFNPYDASRLLPSLPAGSGQYEGFAYLGLGGFVLVLGVLVFAIRGSLAPLPWARLLPILAAGLAAFAFAVLPVVSVFGNVIFTFEPGMDGMLSEVYERLRSSGRFVWISVYAFVLTAILCLPKRRPIMASSFAVLLLCLQAWDLAPLRERSLADTKFRETETHILQANDWQERIERADYIYMSRQLGLDFSLAVGAAAFPLNTPLTWFYTAQGLGLPDQIAAEEQLRLRILNGAHDQRALHLLDGEVEVPLVHRNASGILSTHDFGAFHSLDTLAFESKPEFTHTTHGLTELLQACSEDCTALLVVHDKAMRHISGQVVAWLAMRGSKISTVSDGTGFALALRDGAIVEEAIAEKSDAVLNVLVEDRAISLRSSVTDASLRSSISVDGFEYARATPGINLLLLRDSGQIISAAFDTDNESDSIQTDSEITAPLLAEYSGAAAGQFIADHIISAIPGPQSKAAPKVSLTRLLTEDASLFDVLGRCRQACTMAISVKDEAAANLPFAVRRLAAQMGLTLADLSFRDGYAAIVHNGIVLVQGRSDNDLVDVSERIWDQNIRVQSAGFDAGSLASILVNGDELALGHRGLNIAVIFEGGETISYHFDTHGGV
ncbi:MAG: DUF6311 domain-containing protein [Pseudomonadota bacterium]